MNFVASLVLLAAPTPVLTPHGYDWISIPETTVEAAAAGASAPPSARGRDNPAACEEYVLGDTGVGYLAEEGRVARVTVHKPGVRTAEGVQVGDTAAKVRQVYGAKVEPEPAPYAEAPAEDLYVWESAEYGYRFEVDDRGVVRTIHAGSKAIGYMEGCL